MKVDLLKTLRQLSYTLNSLYYTETDTLYFNSQPVCSLNGLKQIKVSDKGIILEFEDAEPLRVGSDGVQEGVVRL